MSVLDLLGDAADTLFAWATDGRPSEWRWAKRLRRAVLIFIIACASLFPALLVLHLLGLL